MPPTPTETIKPPNSLKNIWLALPLLLGSMALLGWVDYNYLVPLKDLSVPNSGNDFGVFWSGTTAVWQGGNPYPTGPGSLYRAILVEQGANLQPLEPFISPYYLTLFFLPLIAFPMGLAASIWLVAIQLMLVVSVILVIRLTSGRFTARSLLLGLGLALLWRYTFLVMMGGNLSLLLLFALVASYYCSRTGRPFWGGALAAGLMVKPQIAFLIIPLLLLVPTATKAEEKASWWNRATYRRSLGFITVGLFFALYSFALLPGWVGEWLKGVSQTGYSDNPALNFTVTSLRSLVATFAPDQKLVPLLSLLLALPLVGGLVWLWWRNRANVHGFPYVLGVAIALNLLVTPYIRDYDSCLLLFPLLYSFFSLRQLEQGQSGGLRWNWLFWLLAFLPFPVHLFGLQLDNFAVETSIPALVIVATLLVYRRAAKNSAL